MKPCTCSLSNAQLRQLKKGGAIRIKPSQLGGGPHTLMLGAQNFRKLETKRGKGRGAEIRLSPQELEATGGKLSWKGFLRGAKKFYDESGLKPVVRKGLKKGLEAAAVAVPTFFGAPEAAPAARTFAKTVGAKAIDMIGDRTGGWGIARNPADEHLGQWSNFLPQHAPGQQPTLSQKDPLAAMALGKVISGGKVGTARRHPALDPLYRGRENVRNTPHAVFHGGSFLAAGY